MIYPDGTTEEYTYDGDNRITNLTNTKADDTVISSYQYTYDGAGNQLTKTEAKGTTNYTYDYLNRLSIVSEPEGKVTTYTYDDAGNRKTEKVQYGLTGSDTVYNYDNRNRLISTESLGGAYTRYIYDNNGNLVSKTSGTMETISSDPNLMPSKMQNFTLIIKRASSSGSGSFNITYYDYDNYNRLAGTKSVYTSATYRYNAQGYRTEKTINGKTTRYLYEGDKVVLETDASNKQTAFMTYGTNLLYRTMAAEGTAEGTATEASPAPGDGTYQESGADAAQSYYYLYNAHGDVTALIDADGNIAATYDYDAFGNILSKTGEVSNNIRYAGYQYDEESGLYYLNARYYDSVTARFITEDDRKYSKTNDPLSLHLYTYCRNNPIKYDDPSGHAPTKVHDEDTYTIVYAKFCNKIEEESKEIVVYKKDKNGKTVVDKKKTEEKREKWIEKQEEKAKNLAEKLAAGDKYVDQQELISNTDDITKKDYDFKTFHAFNLQENKERSIDVLRLRNFSNQAVDYYMSASKGISPTLSLALGHATYNFTASTISMSEPKTNKDNKPSLDKNGSIATVTASVTLPLGGYTETEKAMFMSGMGLHTLQDSRFHVVEKHSSSPYVDVITYDYNSKKDEWTDNNSEDFTIDGVGEVIDGEYKATVFTGGYRYQETLKVTAKWADRLVDKYGDQMFGYKK